MTLITENDILSSVTDTQRDTSSKLWIKKDGAKARGGLMSLFHMHRRASEKPEVSAVFVGHTKSAFKSRVISGAHNGFEHNNERICSEVRRTFTHRAAVS